MIENFSSDFPKILRRVVQEVSSAGDLRASLDLMVDQIKRAMNTEVCSVYLKDQDSQKYILMATRGLNPEAARVVTLNKHEGLVGFVGDRAEPLNLNDAQSHPRNRFIEGLGEEPFHSFLGVPIIHHRKVLGVLVVQQKETRRFNESEESFLITLSAQLAGVIAHAILSGDLLLSDLSDHSSCLEFRCVSVSGGVGFGTAFVVSSAVDLKSIRDRQIKEIPAEISAFNQAVKETREEIKGFSAQLEGQLKPGELSLFDAFLQMLSDNEITGEVIKIIEEGIWSQSALRCVIESHIAKYESMEDRYLRERASDLTDLGNRVLAKLQRVQNTMLDYPENTILVGQCLTANDLASVPIENLRGFVSVDGSANSHMAILAESLSIPTVMDIKNFPIHWVQGKQLIVGGLDGSVVVNPTDKHRIHYEGIVHEEEQLLKGLMDLADAPCKTKDGHPVNLWINTGLLTEGTRSQLPEVEGVGLYRTEAHFMTKNRFPTEEEQRLIYRAHLKAFDPRPVTMRTLDIGGDKELSYFPIKEENPFLGWRGIRVTLDHREIFLAQVKAMIKASDGLSSELRIMLPLVTNLAEIDEALLLISRCFKEALDEGFKVKKPLVGVLIEVPAAVYLAGPIARRVDFLSVGSNDLIQYMLAVDRNNAQVAELFQEFHPAVLLSLKSIATAAKAEGRSVGVCGEMAGDPRSALLLIAMGYDILSMNAANLLLVKWVLSNFSMSEAQTILNKVLSMDDSRVIQSYVEEQIRKSGLVGALRTHK